MLKRFITSREVSLIGALVLLLGLISLRSPGFIAPANLVNVFNDTSPLILLAIGQMIVILTKCIDLSVAANLAPTDMVVSMLNVAAPDLPIAATLVIAVGLGTLLGMFNGILVWRLAILPIVVTLGTMTVFRGIIFCDFRRQMGEQPRDERRHIQFHRKGEDRIRDGSAHYFGGD